MYLSLAYNKIKFFWSTKATAQSESGIFPSLHMINYPKWTTLVIFTATLDLLRIFEVVQGLTTSLKMTGTTKMGTIEAHILCKVATEATFVVDIFVAVTFYLTSCFTESKFLWQTLAAS